MVDKHAVQKGKKRKSRPVTDAEVRKVGAAAVPERVSEVGFLPAAGPPRADSARHMQAKELEKSLFGGGAEDLDAFGAENADDGEMGFSVADLIRQVKPGRPSK